MTTDYLIIKGLRGVGKSVFFLKQIRDSVEYAKDNKISEVSIREKYYDEVLEAFNVSLTVLAGYKYGHWIKQNNPCFSPFGDSNPYNFICPCCSGLSIIRSKYCPNCGAKMDEEEKING